MQPFQIQENKDTKQSTFAQESPEKIEYEYNKDFVSIGSQGSGNVTAPLFLISKPCDPDNWLGFPADRIALAFWNGDCRYREIYTTSVSNGALGVVIAPDDPTSTPVITSTRTVGTIPGFSISGFLGQELKAEYEGGSTIVVNMFSEVETITTYTSNLIACTDEGDPD